MSNQPANPKVQAEKLRNQNRRRATKYDVKQGDSWFKIAQQVYGDPRMAGELARANGGAFMLHPGMVIRLPGQKRNPYIGQGQFGTTGGTTPAAAQTAPPPVQAAPQTTATASAPPMYGDAPAYIPPGYQYKPPAPSTPPQPKFAPKSTGFQATRKGYGNYRGGRQVTATPDAMVQGRDTGGPGSGLPAPAPPPALKSAPKRTTPAAPPGPSQGPYTPMGPGVAPRQAKQRPTNQPQIPGLLQPDNTRAPYVVDQRGNVVERTRIIPQLLDRGIAPLVITPYEAQSLGIDNVTLEMSGYVQDAWGNWIRGTNVAQQPAQTALGGGGGGYGGYRGGGRSGVRLPSFGGGGGGSGYRYTPIRQVASPTGRTYYDPRELGLISWRI